jgi:peptidoglycan DL-endopeptidase CwlO
VARPRLTRILVAPVVASTMAGVMVLVPNLSSAHADISTKISSAKAQLAKLQDLADAAGEDYDFGRINLANANRVAAQKTATAAAAAAKLVKARQSVAAIATLAYSQGATGDTTLLYQSSDPAGFVERAAIVDSLSSNNLTILAAVHAAQQQATTTARAAAQAVAAAATVLQKLTAAKARVIAAAAAQGTLLDTLVAQQKAEIRAAQIALAKAIAAKDAAAARRARAAELAAQREEAALVAQKARQAQAAASFAQQKDNADDSSASDGDSATTGPSATIGTGDGGSSGSGSSGGSSGGGASGSVGGSIGSSSSSSAAATAVSWARNELGKAYVWAASGPRHFDCSGLTMYVYRQAGVYLPHSSRAQYGSGRHIDRSNLRPGDLVFFGSPIHHVGIYIGNGDMIEAPDAGSSVRVSYAFRGDYVGAVRPS